MKFRERDGLSRREYVRAMVAAGGAAGLAACLEAFDDGDTGGNGGDEEPTVPSGDPEARSSRQHAWDETLPTDDDGNLVAPEHHVLLPLSLATDIDDDARTQVETAFQSLERAYEYSPEGLLFAVGYSHAYFDERVDSDPPIPEPTALTSMETPEFDTFDAVIHLASNHPHVVLEAEEALVGDVDAPNGTPMEATLSGVFEPAEPRRTGFLGPGLPTQHTDLDGVPDSIPEDAPFFMGFRSGFTESQAPEDRVTIQDGPFAGGTTMHISSLGLQLRTWFEQDSHFQRVAKMFSPEHAHNESVGEIGERLGTETGVAGDIAEATESHARNQGMVGHAQKAARARDEDGTPPLLRRDFNTVDGDQPGVHFVSLQRTVDEFVEVRDAMTGADLAGDGVGQRLNNGILQYIFVRRRGNFIVPPREDRSLPSL
ncbi:uncharacterized protein NP_3030A [Natronomonas pharaonis DSM 2160]|uniref:Tat pathway signal protein n=1 Tax=Natronomonas pharaonis (strain ATCC 35678 / DSM 2160 / CIP 103997 / JCM 8858 / NBRC 14720 / NCIMB 2260 / Gabara) TaxID=348780 RepID=A0A1U7EWZ4_NATPD|nr:hypothetical protein [Natronomonas pharaonis]CAI49606.1 uncharacterized protein NP_3030A [Natronomonas pharaonis DSM 2160]